MTDKKNVVTKEEVGIIWNDLEEQVTIFQKLLNRVNRYSNWVTNMSIGLLGFFFALLFQIKTIPGLTLQLSSTIVIIFICLGLAILIGFYIKIRFEIIDIYKILKSMVKVLNSFLHKTIKLFEMKGSKVGEQFNLKIENEKLDRLVYNYPVNLLVLQFIFLVISFVYMSIFLINFLFC